MKIKVTRLYVDTYEIETGFDFTKKQLEIIDCIEKYKLVNKKVPTIREVMKLRGLKSPASVQNHLDNLRKKGYNYKML